MCLPLPTEWKLLSQKHGGKVLIFTSYLLIPMKGKGTSLASEIGGKIDDCMCSDPKKVYSKLHVQIGEGGIHLSKMINQ